MLKIAIVDDEPIMLGTIINLTSKVFDEFGISYSSAGFSSSAEFLSEHEKNPFDIVFLDIQMPENDGFECAERVSAVNGKTFIIFITAEENLVLKSYNYLSFYYIVKNSEEVILENLRKMMIKLQKFIRHQSVFVIDLPYGRTKSIDLKNVVYITAVKNNLLFKFVDNSTFEYREKMEIAEDKLSQFGFVRIHKGFVINITHITDIDYHENKVLLSGGISLIIGRQFRKKFDEQYNYYLMSLI